MLKFTFLTLLILSNTQLQAQIRKPSSEMTCIDGSVRILESGQLKDFKEKFCYSLKENIFVSDNCIKGDCGVLKKFLAKDFKGYDFFSPYSSPGFKLCDELGLKATVVTYVLPNSKTFKSDMCTDSSDDSFINTNTLGEKALEKVK